MNDTWLSVIDKFSFNCELFSQVCVWIRFNANFSFSLSNRKTRIKIPKEPKQRNIGWNENDNGKFPSQKANQRFGLFQWLFEMRLESQLSISIFLSLSLSLPISFYLFLSLSISFYLSLCLLCQSFSLSFYLSLKTAHHFLLICALGRWIIFLCLLESIWQSTFLFN